MVTVRLLGPVSLISDGTDVPLGGAKQRAVLALLALHSPRLVSTDQLVDGVWGDHPPERSRNAVQVYISGLRKALGGHGLIERSGDAYCLVGAGLSVDASDFMTAVAEGRSALRSGDTVRAARVLGAALDSWVGEPLGGVEGLPFHDAARRHLMETRGLARLDRAECLLRDGSLSAAQDEARAAIREHPYEEQAWGVLARAQYHAGRQADALQTCRELREMLGDELGIDPSPALAALELSILHQDLPSPKATNVLKGSPGSLSDQRLPDLPDLPEPFVGRDALVADLRERLVANRLVSLVGLGGIGKTTVARAVARQWASEGGTVHFCELETETTSRGAMERIGRETGLDPSQELVSFGTLGPEVLVVLDNVEQIDDFGPVLGAALKDSGARWLVTSRSALRLGVEVVVPVSPLSLKPDGDSPSPAAALFLALVNRVRPGLGGPAAVVSGEIVCEMLDGIPLAIELMASRTRVLTIEQMRTRLQRGAASALDPSRRVDVPDRQVSLEAIVDSTVGSLDHRASLLLDSLVAMSGWTSLELVAEVVLRAHQTDVTDHVDDLVDAGLVDADVEGRVRVRNPVREFLARRGETEGDLSVIDVVADLVDEVSPTLFGRDTAAGQARLERDHDTITSALARAVARGVQRRAVAITLGLSRYWLLSGRWSEAGRFIEEVLGLPSVEPGDKVRLNILAGTFGSYANDQAAAPRLHTALQQAGDLCLTIDRLVVNGWCCLAALDAQRGKVELAVGHAAEAVRLADLSADPALIALARDVVGFVAAYRGDYEAALQASLAGLAEVRRSGDTYDVVNLLACIADDLVGLGRFEEGLALSTEGFDLVRDLDPGPLLGSVLTAHAFCLLGLGRVPEARGLLTQALRSARDDIPNRMWIGDRLSALAITTAMDRNDEEAALMWGAADAVLHDEGTSARSHLPSSLLVHIDELASRLGDRFALLTETGARSPETTIDRVLA